MKFNLFILFFLLSFSSTTFGQAQAPNLGTASSFAIFTAAGAFYNTGTTHVTGDIGSNDTQPTGDAIIISNESRHFVDETSGKAATDVKAAYLQVGANTHTHTLPTEFGGLTLTAGVYYAGEAATLNGTLTLDGGNNINSLFIIKVNGALTATNSQVILINGASLNNVYFHVNGAVHLESNSTFQGTILNEGAINLLTGATLTGRALSTVGAIHLNGNTVTMPAKVTTLPVVLTSFSAVANPQGIALRWTTASEQDNERFEVERSQNGKTFTKIGEIKGSGTTSVQMQYTFLDMSAPTGTGYYRLRQVDHNGIYEYSNVISGTQKGTALQRTENAYPNPSTGLFILPASDGAVQHYRVFSLLGRALEQGTLNEGNLNLSHLSAGTYLLELTGASGRSIQRLVRQ